MQSINNWEQTDCSKKDKYEILNTKNWTKSEVGSINLENASIDDVFRAGFQMKVR